MTGGGSGGAAPVSPADIEAASLSAWPAVRQQALDGWALRTGQGHTRRSNSVWPMQVGAMPLDAKIAACEQAYRDAGLPVVFRIPSITPERGLDDALAARGYAKDGKSSVRLMDLAGFAHRPDGGVVLEPILASPWLDAFARFDGMAPADCDEHRAIVAATPHPTMFGSIREGGAIVSVGAAVLQDRLVYFNAIATDAAWRRRGLSRRLMVALLDWGRRHGAAYAYLPVAKTNVAGLAFYNGLGFRTELYRYHYRARA